MHAFAFVEEVFRALDLGLESRARSFKRLSMGVLFLLNNIYHIVKSFKNSGLAAMLTVETEKRYELAVQEHTKKTIGCWASIGQILHDSARSNMYPRDRLKAFAAEFEEAVKSLGYGAVPDAGLRNALREEIKKCILQPFTTFYSQNASVCMAFQSKSFRYDNDELEKIISNLFEA